MLGTTSLAVRVSDRTKTCLRASPSVLCQCSSVSLKAQASSQPARSGTAVRHFFLQQCRAQPEKELQETWSRCWSHAPVMLPEVGSVLGTTHWVPSQWHKPGCALGRDKKTVLEWFWLPPGILWITLTEKCNFFYIFLVCSKLFWSFSLRWADDLHSLYRKIYGMQLKSIIYCFSALMFPVLEDNGSNFNWLFEISPVSDSC